MKPVMVADKSIALSHEICVAKPGELSQEPELRKQCRHLEVVERVIARQSSIVREPTKAPRENEEADPENRCVFQQDKPARLRTVRMVKFQVLIIHGIRTGQTTTPSPPM